MSKNYLTEAFKELDLLENQSFDVDKKGTSELEDFLEDDSLDDFEVVIDPEAKTEEDLQNSYLGKVVLCCDVCHSMIYKDPSEVVVDEESQLANVGELCPYCFTGDGYSIVGKVAPFEEVTVEAEKPVEVKVDDKEVEAEDKIEEEIQQDQKFPVNHSKSPVMESGETQKKSREVDTPLYDIDNLTPEQEEEFRTILKNLSGGSKEVSRKNLRLHSKDNSSRVSIGINQFSDEELDKLCKNFGYTLVEEFDYRNKTFSHKVYAVSDIEELEIPFLAVFDSLEEARSFAIEELIERYEDQEVESTAYIYAIDRDLYAEMSSRYDEGGEAFDGLDEGDYIIEDLTTEEALDIKNKKFNKNSKLKESMNDISITTEDQIIKIKSSPIEGKETIQPVTETEVEKSKEAAEDISTEEEVKEESTPVEDVEVDMDEIEESGLDEVSENYLKKVYENVQSFKTSKATLKENNMIVEGIITFTSGKKAKTHFIFESQEITKKGKLRFLGENKQLSKNKKAFTLTGSVKDKKLIVESLNYNYVGVDSKTGQTKRLYGTIRRSK